MRHRQSGYLGVASRRALGAPRAFLPSDLPNLALWLRFGKGITVATGVSQWNDASGNGRNALQATGGLQPALQGDGSILFDGVSQFLATAGFTLNQPCTLYLLFKQVAWTNLSRVSDGIGGAAQIFQGGSTPQIFLNAGTVSSANGNLAVGVYGAVVAVFNGATSIIQVGATAAVTSNAGANNPGGLTLGAAIGGATPSNIQVKEAIAYSGAHDAATSARVIAYLGTL